MATGSVEDRLAALEAEVASLKEKVEDRAANMVPWWDRTAGTFANDPIYEEAMRLGREWRESFWPKSRRRKTQGDS
jgi:hypothetical protein